jgi:hypothetical protein
MFMRLLLIKRAARAITNEVRPISRRLSARLMLLFCATCVTVGAIMSLFWALHEVLYQLIGPGWGALATSLTLCVFAWLLWDVAWRIPLRPRRKR